MVGFWDEKGDTDSCVIEGREEEEECPRPRGLVWGEEGSRDLEILTSARLRSSRPLSVGNFVGKLVRDFGAFPVISNLGMSD